MNLDFSFLDYIWRGLLVGVPASSLVLLVAVPLFFVLQNRVSAHAMKRFLNNQIVLAISVFVGSFFFVSMMDPELAARCFDRFAQSSVTFAITRSIAASWLFGAMVLLMLDVIRLWSAFRFAQGFEPLDDLTAASILNRKLRVLGLNPNSVQLMTDSREGSPFVWGLIRYQLVIPRSILQKINESALDALITHELIHVRDRDSLLLSLELGLRRILFFVPLTWWLGSFYRLAVEKAADEQAVQVGGVSASELMRSLLQVVSKSRPMDAGPLKLGASRDFLELKGRFLALQSSPASSRLGQWLQRLLLGAVFVSFGLSMAQAGTSLKDQKQNSEAGQMCSQVQHERVIEAWLKLEPSPIRCE